MAIKRSKRDSNFTILSNVGLKDDRISAKATGLLAYMLSLPDDWVFYESELVNHFTDGKESIRTGLKELEDFGYLSRVQSREKGKFSSNDWTISDEPTTFPPYTDLPSTVKPTSEKETLLSTNNTKDLYIQNNSSTTLTEDFEKLWKLYPNKQGKKKAFNAYCRAIKKGVTNKQIQDGIVVYKKILASEGWLKPAHGSTWFSNERWEDECVSSNETVITKRNTSWESEIKEMMN